MVMASLAGVITSFIPDRWMPASLIAWKSGFSASKTSLYNASLTLAHVALGVGIFAVFNSQLTTLREGNNGLLLGAFLLAMILVRFFRFKGLKEILKAPAETPLMRQSTIAFSLIGPNEIIIPILIKASGSHAHMVQATVAYTTGLVVTSALLAVVGRKVWSTPTILPRGIRAASQGMTLLPLLMGLGLTALALSKIA